MADVHSPEVLKGNQWHQAAVSFKEGDILKMYIEGKLESENKSTATKEPFAMMLP